MKYIKKPVEVEAYQITKELIEGILFDGRKYPNGLYFSSAEYHRKRRKVYSWFGYVVTIHGQRIIVKEGDWIIAEPDGQHFYPCTPDIFEQTYKAAQPQEGE